VRGSLGKCFIAPGQVYDPWCSVMSYLLWDHICNCGSAKLAHPSTTVAIERSMEGHSLMCPLAPDEP
jgi:hypothetical protein